MLRQQGMIMTKQKSMTEGFTPLRSTPRMWLIFILFLALTSGITIFGLSHFFEMLGEDALATKVFTVEDDKVSLKLPDDWSIDDSSNGNYITFASADTYESLSIAKMEEKTASAASVTFMLEIQGMFPDSNASISSFSEMTISGKKAYVTQVQYTGKYYLLGVMESGNAVIKFVYAASTMAGEISDIDTIIGSIHYRKDGGLQ